MPDRFTLETEEGTQECRIITSLYSKTRNKHYLIYEDANNASDDVFVSSYDPDMDDDYELNDVVDEQEIEEVAKLLEIFMDGE